VLTAVAAQLSGASANRVRTSLSAFFSWSLREGLLDTNPAAWTERREEVARTRLLTCDELREIWAALRDDTYSDIVRLLVLCGARREEIGCLHWGEVDLDQGLISLPAERTKNHRQFEIILSPPALAILKSRPGLTWPDGAARSTWYRAARRRKYLGPCGAQGRNAGTLQLSALPRREARRPGTMGRTH
jgi:integrase